MLLRQTVLYLPAQVLGPVFQLISAFAWTHFLAPAEMGSFALISAAQELAYAMALNWFSVFTIRYYDRAASRPEKDRFHATESGVLIAACLAMALGLATIPLGAGGRLTGALLAVSLAFVISRSLVSYLADRARTEGDAFAYTVLQSSGPVAGFFLGLILVQIMPATAATVLLGYALAQIASLVFAAWRLDYAVRPLQADHGEVMRALGYGLPLFFGGLMVWIANNGLRFLIEWKEGIAAVGLITVGWALGQRAAQFAAMLTTAAAFPLAVRRAREEGMAAGQAQLVDNGVLLVAALAPAIAGLTIIGPPLITLIVAAPYRAITTEVLPMALVTGALRAVRLHFANQVFLLHEKPLIPTLNDGIDAALTVLLGGLGLWLGGLQGCAGGVMTGAAITLATGLILAWRGYAFTFPLADLARLTAATLIMAVAVSCLDTVPATSSLGLAMALGGLVYGAALAALYPARALKAADLAQNLLARISPSLLIKQELKP